MEAGDIVLLRSIYRGSVRWCWPNRYVGTWDGRHGLYCQTGSEGRFIPRGPDGDYLAEWMQSTPPARGAWEKGHVLRFMREGEAHTIEVCWDPDWNFVCWYVNLQAPLAIHGRSFDTTDWALDVVVDHGGAWQWKDEDDLARAIALGALSTHEAATAREEGERVIAEQPWPTGWEDWRPPPSWTPLGLPRDWHVV